MELAALYHRIDGTYGYQNKDGSLTLRIRSKKETIKKISIIYGDRYNWKLKAHSKKTWEWTPEFIKSVPCIQSNNLYDYYEISLNSKGGENRYKYLFIIEDFSSRKYAYGEAVLKEITSKLTFQEIHDYGFTWGYSHYEKYVSAPEWWKETNWYQIFPDRFHNGHSKWDQSLDLEIKTNGTIKGIIEKLDYIKSIGFNGIYLNPIFESNSPHMYDTTSYNEISQSLGTENDFKRLVAELKKRQMRLMLDGVFNHSGVMFAPWQDVLAKKEKSKYKDWFFINNFAELKSLHDYYHEFNDPTTKPYSTFANTPAMPRLNWSNRGLLEYLEKAIRKWSQMGIDAWRLDVADEPSFQFWRQFRHWVRSENSEMAILGEVWGDAKIFLNGDQFDSTMNYRFRNNAIDFIVYQKIDFATFKNDYFENLFRYSKPVSDSQFNLITSHDTPRTSFITKGDTNKNKALFTWLYLNPGATSFYYADEYIETFTGKTPEQGRVLFDWEFSQTSSLFWHVKNVISIRAKNIKSIMSGIRDMNQEEDHILIEYNDGRSISFNFRNGRFK